MKTIITKKHEYLSGWTLYDMTWRTDYTGVRKNMTIQSLVVATQNPFSSAILKKWALDKGCDFDTIFTDLDNCKEDCEKINKLVSVFNEEFGKGLEALNSDNKCHVQYSASINNNYEPLETAFETFHAYDVTVRIEYKSGMIEVVFLSQGREKDSACTRIVFSGNKLKSVYEGDEAIEIVKNRIGSYVEDCDTDEKFKELPRILKKIQADMKMFK